MSIRILSAMIIATVFALPGVPARAATNAEVCANGSVAVVRINAIKATSSRASFDQAVKEHMKWYRDHGFKENDLEVIDVVAFDQASQTASIAANQVMTIHRNPPGPDKTLDLRDAGWEAYVAAYRASSSVVSENTVCLPKRK